MELTELLSPEAVIYELRASGKKQILNELSDRAAAITGVASRDILDTLLVRERLGTTGVGQGIAIPHGRMPAVDRIYGFFAHLAKPVDFESLDDQPVDLVFMLLAPEGAGADHLKALAKISRLLRDQSFCMKLRGCDSADAIYALLTEDAQASVSA
jgi:PTS system nitrogen regulatory IIA component